MTEIIEAANLDQISQGTGATVNGGEGKDSDPARLKNRGYSAGAHRGQQTDHGEHQYGDLKR